MINTKEQSYKTITQKNTCKVRLNSLYAHILAENPEMLRKYRTATIPDPQAYIIYLDLNSKENVYKNEGYLLTNSHFRIDEKYNKNSEMLTPMHYTEEYTHPINKTIIKVHYYLDEWGNKLSIQARQEQSGFLSLSNEQSKKINNNISLSISLIRDLMLDKNNKYLKHLEQAEKLSEQMHQLMPNLHIAKNRDLYKDLATQFIVSINKINIYNEQDKDVRGDNMQKLLSNIEHKHNIFNQKDPNKTSNKTLSQQKRNSHVNSNKETIPHTQIVKPNQSQKNITTDDYIKDMLQNCNSLQTKLKNIQLTLSKPEQELLKIDWANIKQLLEEANIVILNIYLSNLFVQPKDKKIVDNLNNIHSSLLSDIEKIFNEAINQANPKLLTAIMPAVRHLINPIFCKEYIMEYVIKNDISEDKTILTIDIICEHSSSFNTYLNLMFNYLMIQAENIGLKSLLTIAAINKKYNIFEKILKSCINLSNYYALILGDKNVSILFVLIMLGADNRLIDLLFKYGYKTSFDDLNHVTENSTYSTNKYTKFNRKQENLHNSIFPFSPQNEESIKSLYKNAEQGSLYYLAISDFANEDNLTMLLENSSHEKILCTFAKLVDDTKISTTFLLGADYTGSFVCDFDKRIDEKVKNIVENGKFPKNNNLLINISSPENKLKNRLINITIINEYIKSQLSVNDLLIVCNELRNNLKKMSRGPENNIRYNLQAMLIALSNTGPLTIETTKLALYCSSRISQLISTTNNLKTEQNSLNIYHSLTLNIFSNSNYAHNSLLFDNKLVQNTLSNYGIDSSNLVPPPEKTISIRMGSYYIGNLKNIDKNRPYCGTENIYENYIIIIENTVANNYALIHWSDNTKLLEIDKVLKEMDKTNNLLYIKNNYKVTIIGGFGENTHVIRHGKELQKYFKNLEINYELKIFPILSESIIFIPYVYFNPFKENPSDRIVIGNIKNITPDTIANFNWQINSETITDLEYCNRIHLEIENEENSGIPLIPMHITTQQRNNKDFLTLACAIQSATTDENAHIKICTLLNSSTTEINKSLSGKPEIKLMHYACSKNYIKCAITLISHGAHLTDIDLLNIEDKTNQISLKKFYNIYKDNINQNNEYSASRAFALSTRGLTNLVDKKESNFIITFLKDLFPNIAFEKINTLTKPNKR